VDGRNAEDGHERRRVRREIRERAPGTAGRGEPGRRGVPERALVSLLARLDRLSAVGVRLARGRGWSLEGAGQIGVAAEAAEDALLRARRRGGVARRAGGEAEADVEVAELDRVGDATVLAPVGEDGAALGAHR